MNFKQMTSSCIRPIGCCRLQLCIILRINSRQIYDVTEICYNTFLLGRNVVLNVFYSSKTFLLFVRVVLAFLWVNRRPLFQKLNNRFIDTRTEWLLWNNQELLNTRSLDNAI